MQKQDKIIQMFDQIAPTYDITNRILSFGVDISWRKIACKKVLSLINKKDINIVDIACGTGDMLKIWEEKTKKFDKNIINLKGIDPSAKMLEVAKSKFNHIEFIQAFADNLPLQDRSFDILSISYGIRNVVKRKDALREFFRVLDNDGILLVLEFTKRENNNFIYKLRDFYLKQILPIIGGAISKNKQAYKYLPNSIDDFLSKDEFIKELNEIGFKIIECKSFSLGISSMFIARKNEC